MREPRLGRGDAIRAAAPYHARVARTSEGARVRTECRAGGQIVTMEAGDPRRSGREGDMLTPAPVLILQDLWEILQPALQGLPAPAVSTHGHQGRPGPYPGGDAER